MQERLKGRSWLCLIFQVVYVLSELGINDDRRRLVFFAPTEKRVIYTAPETIVKLRAVEGGYDRETYDKGSWYWSSNDLKFHYEIEGVRKPKSMSIRFQYFCESGRSINVVAKGSDSSKNMVIHCQGGLESYVVESPSFNDHLDITFTSPEPAVRLSGSDPRMGRSHDQKSGGGFGLIDMWPRIHYCPVNFRINSTVSQHQPLH